MTAATGGLASHAPAPPAPTIRPPTLSFARQLRLRSSRLDLRPSALSMDNQNPAGLLGCVISFCAVLSGAPLSAAPERNVPPAALAPMRLRRVGASLAPSCSAPIGRRVWFWPCSVFIPNRRASPPWPFAIECRIAFSMSASALFKSEVTCMPRVSTGSDCAMG
jgi:hypothetical protein